jgi:hypothetical protein
MKIISCTKISGNTFTFEFKSGFKGSKKRTCFYASSITQARWLDDGRYILSDMEEIIKWMETQRINAFKNEKNGEVTLTHAYGAEKD